MARKRMGFGDLYCTGCGKPAEKNSAVCPFCGMPYGKEKYAGKSAYGAGGLGWSDQVTNPCFKSHRRKNLVISLVLMIVFCIALYAGLTLSGQLDPVGGLPVFGGIMAIIWIIWIIWLIASFVSRKDWEGVVENKNTYTKIVRKGSSDDNDNTYTEDVYEIHFRKNDGRRKKLVSRRVSEWYDYLNIGEIVRYHGKNMDYYEKYDKRHDTVIPCASCGTKRDSRDTYCGRCGAVLLKGPSVQSAFANTSGTPSDVTVGPAFQAGGAVNSVPPYYQVPQAVRESVSFCPNCGAKNNGGKFCQSCGAKL